MENNLSKLPKNHSFLLDNKHFKVSGVIKIISFLEEKIVLKLDGVSLIITGSDLTIQNLNIEGGMVEATGTVKTMKYTDTFKANVIGKLFK